jgi:hypothetical protein
VPYRYGTSLVHRVYVAGVPIDSAAS